MSRGRGDVGVGGVGGVEGETGTVLFSGGGGVSGGEESGMEAKERHRV